jgi:acyl-CoA thioester hydrolase
MLERALTYRGAVYPWHCDHMGHMNVMWYVGKFDEATWHFFRVLGLAPALLKASGRGMAAVEQHIRYRQELHAGDVISIYTEALEVGDKTIRFAHEMRNDETDAVAATTVLTGVYLDTVARKARPLPDDIKLKARAMLSPDPSKWT